VLLKALAKDRADRYADVMQMVEAFKAAWREAGMPMQGTSMTIAKPVVSTDKTPARADEPTKMAAKAGVAAPALEAKKKRSPFVWVGLVVILVVCLGALFVARQNHGCLPAFCRWEGKQPWW
jgi:hypothetical protein